MLVGEAGFEPATPWPPATASRLNGLAASEAVRLRIRTPVSPSRKLQLIQLRPGGSVRKQSVSTYRRPLSRYHTRFATSEAPPPRFPPSAGCPLSVRRRCRGPRCPFRNLPRATPLPWGSPTPLGGLHRPPRQCDSPTYRVTPGALSSAAVRPWTLIVTLNRRNGASQGRRRKGTSPAVK
jgi:hypothetical protein